MFGLMLEPDEKQLVPFYGAPVCLLMKDGSRKIGQLTSCSSGRLILNGGQEDSAEAAISRKTSVRRAGGRKRSRKPAEAPVPPGLPEELGGWGNLSLAPLGPVPQSFGAQPPLGQQPFGPLPLFASFPKESVPMKTVDSILLL